MKIYKNLSLPIRATIWFTVCSFILKGISFITVPVFTRVMSSVEYGKASIFASYEQIILIFATFEIYLGAYQRGILKYKNYINSFTLATQILCNILTLSMLLISYFFRDWFILQTETNVLIFYTMFAYFLVIPAYECWIVRKRFDYNYKPVVIATILFSLLSTVGGLFAVLYIEDTAIIKIYVTLIMEVLFCLPFYISNYKYFFDLLKSKKFYDYVCFEIKFEGPLVLHSLSYLVLAQADRVMIGSFVGKSQAAYYSVAYSLANLIIIFQNSINQVLTPYRYKKLEKKEYVDICKITNILIIMISVIVIMFILIAPELMKLLFSPSYFEAVWCIPPITLSVYFMFLYSVFVNIESYYGKTHYVLIVSTICAILNIILNYFVLKMSGYIACGYTTLISYIIFSFLHYIFMKKVLKEENICEKVIDGKMISIVSFASIVFVIFITVLYRNIFVRYILLLLFITFVFINRKTIVQTIRNIT